VKRAFARTIMNEWAAGDTTLCTSGQILREHLVVATLLADKNGLGLKRADAVSNVRAILGADRLQGLLTDVRCGGKKVHHANVVVMVLADDVGTVVTTNLADFARFERYVNLVEL
jgi:hypothetical protein